jgi:hypothetical protein
MVSRFTDLLAAERRHDLLLEACRERLITDALGPRDPAVRRLSSYVVFALTGAVTSTRPARRILPVPVPAAACDCGA